MTFEQSDGHGGESVNSTTDWDEIPACALAGVMHEVLQRVLGLKVKFEDRQRILIQTVDVQSAFRQMPEDPDGTAAFGYALGGYRFVDFDLRCSGSEAVRGSGALFKWRCSMRNVAPRDHPRRSRRRGTER